MKRLCSLLFACTFFSSLCASELRTLSYAERVQRPKGLPSLPEKANKLNKSGELKQAGTGYDDELLMHLYDERIDKENVRVSGFDADARIRYASIVLEKHHQPNAMLNQSRINQAIKRLAEVCNYRPEQETPYGVLTHRNAWNLLASEAVHNQNYTDAVEYLLNSLFEEYNAYIEEDTYCFPAHTPFELCTIASLIKKHKDCQARADELTEQMAPDQKRWFLGTLFHTAWQAYAQPDAAWLLAQHEQQYGNAEGAREILQELAAQEYPNAQTELQKVQRKLQLEAFASHVNDYSFDATTPDTKEDLEKIIIDCMNDEARTNKLIELCPTKELQAFVWKTIFNKAKIPAVRFNAAYHQSLLTDNVPHKSMLLQMAVSNGIKEAVEPAFVLCKEIGCTASTQILCSALAKPASPMHAEMVAWLHLSERNKQPAQELLKKLGYTDCTKVMELVHKKIQAGHLNLQKDFANLYREQAFEQMKTTKADYVHLKKRMCQIQTARQQACGWYRKAVQLPDSMKQEKIDIHHNCANMHLHLANMAEAKAKDALNKVQKEKWGQFSRTELEAAREQLNLILKADKNNARAHSQLGVVYMQDGQRDKAIESLLQAHALDHTYGNSFENLLYICKEDVDEIFNLENIRQKAAADKKASYNSKIKSLIKSIKRLAGKLTILDPDCHRAWNHLGFCAEKEGQPAQAIEQYTQGALAAYRCSEASLVNAHVVFASLAGLYGKGIRSMSKMESTQIATSLYTQALEINPQYAEARHNLGLIHAKQNNDKKAISNMQQSAQHGCAHANHRLAVYMTSGYGGYYNLEDAMWQLIDVIKAYKQSGNTDSLQKATLHLKLAEYSVANYLDHHARKKVKNNLSKQNSKAYMQARLELLEDAITTLKNYRHNADSATQATIDCTCGLLNIHQAADEEDSRQSEEHYEQGMNYLKQAIKRRDPHDIHAARNLYFYTSLLLDYPKSLYQPYDELESTQQQTLTEAIELLKYITQDVAKVQPHNFFVGKAHELLGKIRRTVYEDIKAAQNEYEEGIHIGHMGCALKLARGYETGSLTDDGQSNLKKAREVLETAVKKGDPRLKHHQTAQRDLWVFNRELGIENTDKGASIFLQTFDILKKIEQENRCPSIGSFFTTWNKMNEDDKVKSSRVINSKLPEEHDWYELQQKFRRAFPYLKGWDGFKLHFTLNELCTKWHQLPEELPFSHEERDALYARI